MKGEGVVLRELHGRERRRPRAQAAASAREVIEGYGLSTSHTPGTATSAVAQACAGTNLTLGPRPSPVLRDYAVDLGHGLASLLEDRHDAIEVLDVTKRQLLAFPLF